MVLINLEGEREALTQNSEQYGKKVIEYLQLKDYYLEHDANIEGLFQDKIFRRPKFDGNVKTAVEIKDTEISISSKNKDFLNELAKYLVIYSKERFFFMLFARKLSNVKKWESIFDPIKEKPEEIEELKNKIAEVLDEPLLSKFKKVSEKLTDFIRDSQIIQVSYTRIIQKIDQIKKDKLFNFDAEYLKEKEDLIFETNTLTSNIFEIKSLPPKIIRYKLTNKSNFNEIWRNPIADHFVQHKGFFYSFKNLPKEFEAYIVKGSKEEVNFDEIGYEPGDLITLKKWLIRAYIISKSSCFGYYYNRKLKCLYFPHYELKVKDNKVKVEAENIRKLSSVYYKNDGSVNFISHRGLKFDVLDIDQNLFVVFDNFRIFTKDGQRVISGESAKKLHSKFPPTKAFNDAEKSKLLFLIRSLGLKNKDFTHKYYIHLGYNVNVESPCKVTSGEIFAEDETFIQTLHQFLGDDINVE